MPPLFFFARQIRQSGFKFMAKPKGVIAMINFNNHFFLSLALICGICLNQNTFAQDKDVDQADSLDFGAFHKDKKEAIKVWDKTSDAPTKAYSDQPTDTKQTSAVKATDSSSTPVTPTANAASPAAADEVSGKRFELRERYTLTRSAKTPYSAFYVIEPLYKQAAQLCAKGWKKISERSEPVEQDYYLYYQIECL